MRQAIPIATRQVGKAQKLVKGKPAGLSAGWEWSSTAASFGAGVPLLEGKLVLGQLNANITMLTECEKLPRACEVEEPEYASAAALKSL